MSRRTGTSREEMKKKLKSAVLRKPPPPNLFSDLELEEMKEMDDEDVAEMHRLKMEELQKARERKAAASEAAARDREIEKIEDRYAHGQMNWWVDHLRPPPTRFHPHRENPELPDVPDKIKQHYRGVIDREAAPHMVIMSPEAKKEVTIQSTPMAASSSRLEEEEPSDDFEEELEKLANKVDDMHLPSRSGMSLVEPDIVLTKKALRKAIQAGMMEVTELNPTTDARSYALNLLKMNKDGAVLPAEQLVIDMEVEDLIKEGIDPNDKEAVQQKVKEIGEKILAARSVIAREKGMKRGKIISRKKDLKLVKEIIDGKKTLTDL